MEEPFNRLAATCSFILNETARDGKHKGGTVSHRTLRANSLMPAVSIDQRATLQAEQVQYHEQESGNAAELR